MATEGGVGVKLLAVDDNEDVREMLQASLREYGCDVTCASNGAEALEMARSDPPDVVISDILMPVMDGFSLCREWRRDERLRTIPFVFYTCTFTDPRDRDLAVNLGADGFVVKPAEAEVIAALLRDVVEEHRGGVQAPADQDPEDEETFLRSHREAVTRKLEDKVQQLEELNLRMAREDSELEETHAVLRERSRDLAARVKELDCLYGISQIFSRMDVPLSKKILDVLDLMPPAWQYPEIASARIVVENCDVRTPDFRETAWRQASGIKVRGEVAGSVEVRYLEERPEADEGPFLDEERRLINAIAGQLGRGIELAKGQADLKRSQQQWQTTFDAIGTGICLLDDEARILQCNEAMTKLVARPRDEILRRHWWELVQGTSVPVEECSVTRTRETLERETLVVRSADRWFEVTADPVIDDTGRLTSTVLLMGDVSDRKRTEEALQESEERLQRILTSSPDAIIVTDVEGNITTCNERSVELLGFQSKDEVSGKGVIEFVVPEGRRRAEEDFEAVFGGAVVRDAQYTITRRDGSPFPAEISASAVRDADGEVMGFVTIMKDIADRKRDEAELIRRLISEEIVSETSSRFVSLLPDEMDTALRDTLARAGRFLRLDRCCLWLAPGDADASGSLYQWHAEGTEERAQETAGLADSTFLWAKDRLEGSEHIVVPCVGDMPVEQKPGREALLSQGVSAMAAVPVAAAGSLNGFLGALVQGSTREWRPEEITLLGTLGEVFAGALARRRAAEVIHDSLERVRWMQTGTVNALSNVAEVRDPYTAGHQRRVAHLAHAIAHEMGYPSENLEGILVAGLLHDIGKIHLPAEILAKPGPLDEPETTIMRTHPAIAHRILEPIEFPWPVAQVALQHHERLDGSGYPNGLAGEEILLESRIIGVADVMEAMISHRPYRPALPMEVALDEISTNRGVLYDDAVVEACLRLACEIRLILDGLEGEHP